MDKKVKAGALQSIYPSKYPDTGFFSFSLSLGSLRSHRNPDFCILSVYPGLDIMFTSHMVGLAPDPTISDQRVKELTMKINMTKIKIPSVEEMLEKGVHFGHQVRRQNPIMKKYVYSIDKKSHIIDLFKTEGMLQKACGFLYQTAKSGKQIVIVGTKRQASPLVEKYAKESGALFVNQRWLGGTLTNFDSIKSNWVELQRLVEGNKVGTFKRYTKKEQLLIERKIERLKLVVGGIQNMEKYPGAIIVVDVKRERTAVHEANALNVPVVGIVDTNSSPSGIDYVIPANDDAIKSIDLLLGAISSVISQGHKDAAKKAEESKSTAQTQGVDKAPKEEVKKNKPAVKKNKKSPNKLPSVIETVTEKQKVKTVKIEK